MTLNKKNNSAIFNSLIRDLKRPLVLMARSAELGKNARDEEGVLDSIQETAEQTLKLIDNYLLIARSEYGQTTLPLETVGIGSIIYEVAQELRPVAEKANVEIVCKVSDSGVMTNTDGLKAAIWCLGDMAIGQESTKAEKRLGTININAKKSGENMRVSVLSENMELKPQDIRQARKHQGKAHKALSSDSTDSGIRLAVADMLSEALGTSLSAVKENNLRGIGFELIKSRQLRLV